MEGVHVVGGTRRMLYSVSNLRTVFSDGEMQFFYAVVICSVDVELIARVPRVPGVGLFAKARDLVITLYPRWGHG